MLFALAFIAAFALIPASAGAETFYSHVGEFGATGSTAGEFENDPMPQRIAVHEESGKLFVADRGNDRIQVFEPTATGADFDFAFGDAATTSEPIGVAVDQDTGDLYVTAAGSTNAIVKFNPEDSSAPTAYTEDATFTSPAQGTGAGQIGAFQSGPDDRPNGGGIAVDPTTGDILLADPGRNLVQRFDSDGAHLDDFTGCAGGFFCTERPAFTGIRDLAVTSSGDIVVADVDGSEARVDRFDPTGELEATLSEANDPVPNRLGSGGSLVVAVHPDTDEVFVTSVTGSPLTPQPSQVFQFEDDEHVAEFSAPDNFSGYIFGLAARGTDPGRFHALAGADVPFGGSFGTPTTPRIQVYDAVIPPSVTMAEPSEVGATEATFSGTVNPAGSPTEWYFEYRVEGEVAWSTAPDPPGDAGDGTTDVGVDITAEDLEPNTNYEVRLVASGAGGVIVNSAIEVFTTEPDPPLVTTGIGTFLSESGAMLIGYINPRNSETTYYIEYGPDTGYGTVVPDSAAGAGDGGTRLTVSETVSGLEPGTTYHFRLVAENQFGQVTVGKDATLTTLGEAPGGLVGSREWELVRPLPTGGVRTSGSNTFAASEDGDSVRWSIGATDPHLPGFDKLPHRVFIADRGGSGWTNLAADLPRAGEISHGYPTVMPPKMSRWLAGSTASHHPDDQNGVSDLYMLDRDGGVTWMTRSLLDQPGEPQTDDAAVGPTGSPGMSALSEDGSTLVFLSQRRLAEDDPHPSGPGHYTDPGNRLYKWSDGELSAVSVRPDESVATGVTLGNPSFTVNAVSRDGSRVFWRDGTTIYAHIEGSDPVEVGAGTYAGATPDGSRVFFQDEGRVYAFEIDTETSSDLTGPAGVLGVAAVAEAGSRVYFVATTVLNSDPSPLGEKPIDGANNLYLVEVGDGGEPVRTRFIATLGASNGGADGNIWSSRFTSRATATNRSGKVFAFGSVESLTGKPTAGNRQLFVYDDDADSLLCASCPADGSPPEDGNVNSGVGRGGDDLSGTSGWSSNLGYKRWVAEDGTVFFSTRTPLLPEDENRARDVYEYRSGEIRLVSRGAPEDGPVEFAGASTDGRTAFLLTGNALVPQDTEPGVTKVYAARVGGGFPPLAPTPDCIGDECQESRAPSPEFNQPASSRPGELGTATVRSADRCKQLVAAARQRIAAARRLISHARRFVVRSRRVLASGVGARTTRRLGTRYREVRRQVRNARRGALESRQRAIACARAGR